MKRIALWGYYGFGNVGDEALLSTVLPHLEDVVVHLFSGDKPSVIQGKNLILESRSPKNLLRIVRRCDGFILGPGGLLHEHRKIKSSWYHLAGPILSKILSKSYIAIGQQIGSFKRSSTRKLVKFGLSKSRQTTVRDRQSFKEAKDLKLDTTLSADMAFLIKPQSPSKQITDKILELPQPRIAFTPAMSDNYKPDPKFIATILDNISAKTDGSIIMLPFFPDRDDEMIGEIANHMTCRHTLKISSPIDWQDAFGVYQLVDYSIPMRLHAMIASTISHKPFLPILYHEKVERIGRDIGCTRFITEDTENINELIDDFLAGRDKMVSQINESLPGLVDRAILSVNALQDFIHEISQCNP